MSNPDSKRRHKLEVGGPRVAIIGAGLAGLTAALRLSERGYQVTVFERDPLIGGSYGAKKIGDTYHEHSYHMFTTWYHNFWKLVKELGLCDQFESHHSIKYLRPGQFPSMKTVSDVGSPRTICSNMMSGLASPPQWFLYGYSLMDITSALMPRQNRLDTVSITGFLHSQWYATDETVRLNDMTVAKAFALSAELTSARAYGNFIRYGQKCPAPMMWMLKGNCYTAFLEPLKKKLESAGCTIKTQHSVEKICLDEETKKDKTKKACKLRIGKTDKKESYEFSEFDYLIVTVTPQALGKLVDWELFEADPELARVHVLRSSPMGSLDLYFTKKLPDIPRDIVVLLESKYDLTFLDNSQLWPNEPHTILNVVVSDYTPLVEFKMEHVIYEILIPELQKYVPFDLDDVDKNRTHLRSHTPEGLFSNQVDSWDDQPTYACKIPNVFLAGAFCRSVIDVVTIEGAVVTGLMAAEAVRQRSGGPGDAIEIEEPDAIPMLTMYAAAILLAPYAGAAKGWLSAKELWRRYAGLFGW